jgi:hypothetical protein
LPGTRDNGHLRIRAVLRSPWARMRAHSPPQGQIAGIAFFLAPASMQTANGNAWGGIGGPMEAPKHPRHWLTKMGYSSLLRKISV